MDRRLPLAAGCLALAGCGGGAGPALPGAAPVAEPAARLPQADGWEAIATPGDRARLRDWRGAWTRALAAARAGGHGAEIAREGALLLPDAALPGPVPPAGAYRCRVTKLGAQQGGGLAYIAYPPFACRITAAEGGLLLAKLTGSQRPVGRLLPDGGSRMVFLGTMLLSDERAAQPYGRDAERDMIGAFERVGPARWRLVLPSPRWESLLDVFELVPA